MTGHPWQRPGRSASRPATTMSLPRRAAQAVAESRLPDWVGDAQQLLYRPSAVGARSPLHTDALGHSLHPALTDLTLGCWTSATLLDLVGGPSSRHAATLLTAAGIAAAIPTAVAGAADWAQTTGDERRVGAVHALGADAATFLSIASLTPDCAVTTTPRRGWESAPTGHDRSRIPRWTPGAQPRHRPSRVARPINTTVTHPGPQQSRPAID